LGKKGGGSGEDFQGQKEKTTPDGGGGRKASVRNAKEEKEWKCAEESTFLTGRLVQEEIKTLVRGEKWDARTGAGIAKGGTEGLGGV